MATNGKQNRKTLSKKGNISDKIKGSRIKKIVVEPFTRKWTAVMENGEKAKWTVVMENGDKVILDPIGVPHFLEEFLSLDGAELFQRAIGRIVYYVKNEDGTGIVSWFWGPSVNYLKGFPYTGTIVGPDGEEIEKVLIPAPPGSIGKDEKPKKNRRGRVIMRPATLEEQKKLSGCCFMFPVRGPSKNFTETSQPTTNGDDTRNGDDTSSKPKNRKSKKSQRRSKK